MLSWFQERIDPYPETPPRTPPKGWLPFMWALTHGVRRFLLGMTMLTALIAAFEALLFAMLGDIVDWLSHIPPAQLFTRERDHLLMLAGVLLLSQRFHSSRVMSLVDWELLVMFMGLYVGKRGFLDGKAGLVYALLRAIYEYMIVLKVSELKTQSAQKLA